MNSTCNKIQSEEIKLIKIAESQSTEFSIFIGSQASLPEQFAAKELRKYLLKICNCQFDIQIDPPVPNQPGFYIGVADKTHPASSLLFDRKIALKLDGFAIIPIKKTILFIGNTPRSCIYATYAFLEQLGCRWYHLHPKDQIIPQKNRLTWQPNKIISNPHWKRRIMFFTPQESNEKTIQLFKWGIDWMVKNRFNQISLFAGEFKISVWTGEPWDSVKQELLPEIKKRGLDIELGGHVFHFFINPETYFAKKPEYFSLINGKRNNTAQLCLSNPELTKEFSKNLIEYFQSHPETNVITLAPNDYWNMFCECDECRKLSKSDNLMNFTNQILTDLKRQIPKIKQVYVAYAAYVDPPRKVPPKQDLTLFFCAWDRCYAHSIANPKCTYNNEHFWIPIQKWKKFVDREMWLYEYYGTANIFRSNMIPLTRIIKQDIMHASSMNFQGFLLNQTHIATWWTYGWNDYYCGRLLWNMQSKTQNIFNEYLENMYGAAASIIKKHFSYMERISQFDGNYIRRSFPRGEGKKSLEIQIKDLGKIDKILTCANANLKETEKISLEEMQLERVTKCRISLAYTIKDLQILQLHTMAKYLLWCAEEIRGSDEQKTDKFLSECKTIFSRLKSLIKETNNYVINHAKRLDGLFFVVKIAEEYDKILADIKTREEKMSNKKESFTVYNSPLLMSTHDPKATGAVIHYKRGKRHKEDLIISQSVTS